MKLLVGVEREATTSGDAVIVQLCDEPATAAMLPESILHHVVRTSEGDILDDAATQLPFAADPYIVQRRARSILCFPLINYGDLQGLLYLENNLTSQVFAPARIAVLKLLASQAAIALENTRLYRDLAEREARIRRLVEANIIGIFIWDFDGRILEANDAFLQIVGYERQDLVAGRIRWTDLTPPEWLERDAQWIQEHKQTGLRPPIEKEYFRKDGSRAPVLLAATNFDESENEGVAFVLDLTERKLAEVALRESEEQWKAVFENNPVMYFVVDEAATIISVNRFGAEQLGYGVDELVGRPVDVLFHQADRESTLRNQAACIEHRGQTMTWELRKLRKNGEALWVRETARAMLIKNRSTILVVSEDITEAKRAAEALRESQMELAHANRVATMGQLTASVAHEVSQPIASARNNASAALKFLDRRPPDIEEVREALNCIVNDADRAGKIIDRIRDQIKKAPPRKDNFELNEAIREVIALAGSEAVKNGVLGSNAPRERLASHSGRSCPSSTSLIELDLERH